MAANGMLDMSFLFLYLQEGGLAYALTFLDTYTPIAMPTTSWTKEAILAAVGIIVAVLLFGLGCIPRHRIRRLLSLQFKPRWSYTIFEGTSMPAICAHVANMKARYRTRGYTSAISHFELGRYQKREGRSAGNVHDIRPLATRASAGEARGDGAAVKHITRSMGPDDKSIAS
jgi:hypothetical protein